MVISWIGIGVCLGVFVLGAAMGDTLLVALLVSLAFGATSVATLTALGGASPLIYIVPMGFIIASVFFRRGFTRKVGLILRETHSAWLVLGLAVWSMLGAFIMPRLFKGNAITLVTTREFGVIEAPLNPVSGNISQTMYLLFGCTVFLALGVILRDHRRFVGVRRGFIGLATLIAIFGLIDFFAKAVGLGDVLFWMRTANYALLTESEEAGFARIVGSFPEASAFAAASLPMLAYTYTYWRRTGSKWMMSLAAVLLFLNLFSTSTTSLVGIFLLCLPVGLSMLGSMSKGTLSATDAKLLAVGVVVLAGALAMLIVKQDAFEPFVNAFERIVLQKSQTASGQERGYWNAVAIGNVFETFGLGVGMGSSRASSWALAALSQLGLPGMGIIFLLAWYLWRGVPDPVSGDPFINRAVTTARAARAAGIAAIAVGSISGGSADPGLYFFTALAVTHAVRRLVLSETMRLRTFAPVGDMRPAPRAREVGW